MDWQLLLTVLHESIFVLVVFGSFLILGLWKGRYTLVTIIFSLYLAVLLINEFPYLDKIIALSPFESAVTQTVFFIILTLVSFFLFRRHIPGDDHEKTFENFPVKALLAIAATIVIMAFTYNVLPLAEFFDSNTPLEKLFANENYFFWWLLLPLIVLFFI